MNDTNLKSIDDINELKKEESHQRRNGLIGGVFLILIGGLLLLGQFFSFDSAGLLFLPLLATAFIIWGILTSNAGLFIPGGILGGIGLGAALMELPALAHLEEGGIFLLSFAAGWVLISILSALFTKETHWWPLIPAGILGFIGIAVITNGFLLNVLSFVGQGWPLILIAVGLYIILRPEKAQEWLNDEEAKPDSM